jgi:Zn-dependent protease/CBS domain-containing protein
MRWSFKIARIAGIDVRIHATFFLLLGFVAYFAGHRAGASWGLNAVLIWLLVFLCVLLHELGHALAAKAYGIPTVDITLYPIGGVARMERMPEKPVQELVVAIAGPLVNVVIIIVLGAVLFATGGLDLTAIVNDPNSLTGGNEGNAGLRVLLQILFWTNIVMVIFNLIPAFPLDGGRVLRALLATRMEYALATRVAAGIGQGLALALGIFAAFTGQILLILIAIFIYMAAESEAAVVQMRSVTAGLPVSSAMMTRFDTLDHRSTLNQAIDVLLGTSQHEFPVLDDNGGFAGLLTKHDLLVALRNGGADTLVTDVMVKGLPTVLPQTSLDRALDFVRQAGVAALPVLDNTGRLVGLFTPENVSELLMVRTALGKKKRGAA